MRFDIAKRRIAEREEEVPPVFFDIAKHEEACISTLLNR
jgi:hypothetical protein